jgi:hypothetical protein
MVGPSRVSLVVLAALLALSPACGDDGRPADEGTATGTTPPTTTLTPTTGDVTPTGSATGSTSETAGSVSDSATGSTSEPTGATAPTTTDGSASATTTATTGEPVGPCSEDPPPGFMAPFDADCKTEPQLGMFDPVVEWHKDTFVNNPGATASASAPIVVQVNDDNGDGKVDSDDMPDILNSMYNPQAQAVLRALSGDGSGEILSIVVPSGTREEGIAAADIDGDGFIEILTSANNGEQILAYEHDGTLKWTSPMLTVANTGTYETYPAILDMNGDGKPEIVAGRVILNSAGSQVGVGAFGIGAPTGNANGSAAVSFAADLDGDGKQEVVVGNALYRADGTAIWSNGQTDGYPAIADFDGDMKPEIVVSGFGKLRLQNGGDGALLWTTPIPGGKGGPPTIADYDGDGLPEVGIAGLSKYTVFDTDGAVLWTKDTQDGSSGITGSAVYDFEGDGVADVVYADEINLYVFSGTDGTTKLQFTDHNSGTRLEYPIIADVDRDGQVEIVVVSEPYNGTYTGITVLGDKNNSWRPGRQIWNQHAYSITHINDDGTVPAMAAPNWDTYNNFRSGDLSPADGLTTPDLVLITPESCLSQCTGPDELALWVQLGNLGAAPLTAGATVEVYGTVMGVESLQTSVDFPGVLQPGEYAAATTIPINTKDLEQLRVVAVANEVECKPDPANEILLMPPFCMAPG